MEEWQEKVVVRSIDKLIKTTTCGVTLLATLQAAGALCQEDLNILNALNGSSQTRKLYDILVTRQNGFEKLMDGLQKTNQTGALKILFEGAITQTTLVDIGVVCVDEYHLLGKGAYGSVFKGKLGDRNVAIKQFKLDPSRIIDAMQEISILKTCDMHENIVKYYGCKHQNEHLLIILEFCDLNLTNWVKNKSIEITPLEVLHQTTKGLSWLHHQKIVHRDLKPENILLTRKLVRVKLSDFGLSRQVADGHSHILTKNDAGTEGWLAPEILNQQLDESSNKFMFTYSSDVFALGCICYFVLTDGKHAFGHRHVRQANIFNGQHVIVREDMNYVCNHNVLFIQQMISRNPEYRPTCTALLHCPMFWSQDRSVVFLIDVLASNLNLRELDKTLEKNEETCKVAHFEQHRSFCNEKIFNEYACVVPEMYTLFQNIEGPWQRFYTHWVTFSDSQQSNKPKIFDSSGKNEEEATTRVTEAMQSTRTSRHLALKKVYMLVNPMRQLQLEKDKYQIVSDRALLAYKQKMEQAIELGPLRDNALTQTHSELLSQSLKMLEVGTGDIKTALWYHNDLKRRIKEALNKYKAENNRLNENEAKKLLNDIQPNYNDEAFEKYLDAGSKHLIGNLGDYNKTTFPGKYRKSSSHTNDLITGTDRHNLSKLLRDVHQAYHDEMSKFVKGNNFTNVSAIERLHVGVLESVVSTCTRLNQISLSLDQRQQVLKMMQDSVSKYKIEFSMNISSQTGTPAIELLDLNVSDLSSDCEEM